MTIDFHTHVFPENVAPKAIAALETAAGEFNLKAVADGTINSLKESMRDNCIDYSVTFGVATKAAQVSSINNWAIENNTPTPELFFSAQCTLTMKIKLGKSKDLPSRA